MAAQRSGAAGRCSLANAVLAAVAWSQVAGAPDPCERGFIRIGGANSRSGGYFIQGRDLRNGAILWASKVNSSGGLNYTGCPKLLPVQLDFRDDQSDVSKVMEITRQLISEVDYFLGPYSSKHTAAASPISESGRKIMVAPAAAADSVYGNGLKFLFSTSKPARGYMSAGLTALFSKGARSVVIAAENDPFSISACEGAEAFALSKSMSVLRKTVYPFGDLDYIPIVRAWEGLPTMPDVVVACGHFEDSIVLAATTKVRQFNPKAFLVTVIDGPRFVSAAGPNISQDVLGPNEWLPELGYAGGMFQSAAAYTQEYDEMFGERPSYQAAKSSAAMEALGMAIENATNPADADSMREAMRSLNFTSFYGPVSFQNNGALMSEGIMPTIQIAGREANIVAPPSLAKATLRYPRRAFDPGFDNRSVTEVALLTETFIRSTVDLVEASFQTVPDCDCDYQKACPWNPGLVRRQYSPWPFGVSFDTATLRLPTNLDLATPEVKRSICLLSGSSPTAKLWPQSWQAVGGPLSLPGYQMFGDQATGALSIYPGIEFCDNIDYRFRPWYAAAASGPKNVIVVLDTSGSMLAQSRIDAARTAAARVLDTLIWADHVSVVAFNSVFSVYGDGKMYQMTDGNRTAMQAWVRNLQPQGGTDFELAFNTAFKVIGNSQQDGRFGDCATVILFMTDGVATLDLDFLVSKNKDVKAKIFTYQFGSESTAELLKGIACSTGGIWWRVPDGGDLASIMASYYKYFAALSRVDRVSWQRYTSVSLKAEMITGCLPAFDSSSTPKQLVGVACADPGMLAPLAELEGRADWAVFEQKMRADTLRCPELPSSESTLEQLRVLLSGDEAACGSAPSGARGSASMVSTPDTSLCSSTGSGSASSTSRASSTSSSSEPIVPPVDIKTLAISVSAAACGVVCIGGLTTMMWLRARGRKRPAPHAGCAVVRATPVDVPRDPGRAVIVATPVAL